MWVSDGVLRGAPKNVFYEVLIVLDVNMRGVAPAELFQQVVAIILIM